MGVAGCFQTREKPSVRIREAGLLASKTGALNSKSACWSSRGKVAGVGSER